MVSILLVRLVVDRGLEAVPSGLRSPLGPPECPSNEARVLVVGPEIVVPGTAVGPGLVVVDPGLVVGSKLSVVSSELAVVDPPGLVDPAGLVEPGMLAPGLVDPGLEDVVEAGPGLVVGPVLIQGSSSVLACVR